MLQADRPQGGQLHVLCGYQDFVPPEALGEKWHLGLNDTIGANPGEDLPVEDADPFKFFFPRHVRCGVKMGKMGSP